MRETVQNKCDLFADNFLELNKKFKWTYTINNRLGALLYTMDNRTVNIEGIQSCRDIIKGHTGIFSQFKDIPNFMVATILSLKKDPDVILKHSVAVYDALRAAGFYSAPYLVISAVSIAMYSDADHFQDYVLSAKQFYDAMKEEHRFITSSDDYGFAALLALAEKPVEQTIREMENCYTLLKQDFSNSNAVQALSQVLSFSMDNVPAKCKRVVDLFYALKNRGCKFGLSTELSFLGVVASLQQDVNILADEIAEINNYLKEKKGFGYWSVSATERLMFAAAIVCDNYLEDVKKDTISITLSNNIASILLAQQMATIAVTSSVTAAAAASSSSY